MSSGSSTEPRPAADSGLQAWHFYLLLSMAAAIVAVLRSQDPHPAALFLISAAVVAAGIAAAALHYALTGFLGTRATVSATRLDTRTREALLADKALVLRSLKELEFDHAMRKVSDADFAALGSRLRARALDLMRQLDLEPAPPAGPALGRAGEGVATADDVPAAPAREEVGASAGVFAQFTEFERARPVCAVCGRENDADARFCKQCGARIA
jgi:hypothetical protein